MEQEVTTKPSVEQPIMASNEKKYHQTEGRGQLQKGIFLREFGTMGIRHKADQVLQGIYQMPQGTLPATKTFVQAMKHPAKYYKVPPVTYLDYYEGWKKAKECTSSNGPHFGHYKVAIHHNKIGQLLYQ